MDIVTQLIIVLVSTGALVAVLLVVGVFINILTEDIFDVSVFPILKRWSEGER